MAFDGGFGLGFRKSELPIFGGTVGVIPSPRPILARQKLTLNIDFDATIRHKERIDAEIDMQIHIPCSIVLSGGLEIRAPIKIEIPIHTLVRKTEKIGADISTVITRRMLFTMSDISRVSEASDDVGKVFEAHQIYQMHSMSKLVKVLNS